MVDTGEADKLVNYKRQAIQLQADTQGYVTEYRLAEALFMRLTRSHSRKTPHRPNNLSDCAPRLIPPAGGHPTQKKPAFPHI